MSYLERDEYLATIHRECRKKNLGLATAESLTAGLIASTIARTSGSSAYLRGGIVAYTLDAKVNLLGVDRELAAACNCVSDAVAFQMALGVQKALGADVGIAVTGYAEPWPEGGISTPFAHYAIVWGSASVAGHVIGNPHIARNEMREKVVEEVLRELAWMLEGTE